MEDEMPLDITARPVYERNEAEQRKELQRTPVIPARIYTRQPIKMWTPPLGDLSSLRKEINNTLIDVEDHEEQNSWWRRFHEVAAIS